MKRFTRLSLVLALAAGCGGNAQYAHPGGQDEPSYAGGESTSDNYAEAETVGAYEQSPSFAPPQSAPEATGDTYADTPESALQDTRQDSVATFSLDVDTASYTRMRAALTRGALPDPRSVRAEEYINFFEWSDLSQEQHRGEAPFATRIESAPSPFGENGARLMRVDVQAVDVSQDERRHANLVFLVDTSGSMGASNKLPLLKYALSTMVDSLRPDDTIGIVTYASGAGTLLEPTPVRDRVRLLSAIESLGASGSTNGEGGIRQAYDLAAQHFHQGGINRVILASDGDFNVGLTGRPLIELIERFRERDITLTTLGFGIGNDRDMEALADHGNGMYAYIDNQREAVRVLSERLTGTIQVVAKDVKVQVEFDPAIVATFRLIGYDNRILAHEDFENDAVDAGDVGAGQSATAYFEYTLRPGVQLGASDRIARVHVRYKAPDGDESKLVSIDAPLGGSSFARASAAFRFGTAVGEFAEILRGSEFVREARLGDVQEMARSAQWGQAEATSEFVALVGRAMSLQAR